MHHEIMRVRHEVDRSEVATSPERRPVGPFGGRPELTVAGAMDAGAFHGALP